MRFRSLERWALKAVRLWSLKFRPVRFRSLERWALKAVWLWSFVGWSLEGRARSPGRDRSSSGG